MPKRTGAPIIVSAALLWLVSFAHAATSSSPRDNDTNAIVVTAMSGSVAVSSAGAPARVEVTSTVGLPAHIVTGSDGMLGLAQARTSITVAADSELEIPAEAAEGNLIARLVQHRGNVFYDVAHRDVGKLRVETPFLVAVIKGTQFNVAVQDDSTTISLFEGRLEIRTPDGGDVVQLNAGEIAIRSRADGSIRVVGMNDDRVPAPSPVARAAGSDRADAAGARAALPQPRASSSLADTLDAPARQLTADRSSLGIGAEAPALDAIAAVSLGGDSSNLALTSTGVSAALDLGAAGMDLGVTAEIAVGSAAAALDAGLELGAAGLDVGVSVGADLGAGALDLGVASGVDLGGAGLDLGAAAGVDLGAGALDLGVASGADLGGAGLDLGTAASADLGAGALDLDVTSGADLGGAVADLGLDAGIDAGAGSLAPGIDTSLDLGVAAVTPGVDAGLELGSGTVDAGVSVDTGLGIDLDLNLGLDDGLDIDLGLGGATPTNPPAPAPPGGVLGGLLGRLL